MVLDELIPMLADAGPRHVAGRVPRLVDGRLRRAAARRAARRRPAPRRSVRSARHCGRHRARRHRARSTAPTTTRPTACGACPRWIRSRSESTAATAIRSTRRPSSSSPSCPTRRRAGSPPAGMTARSGARSCPPRSPGWHRCWSPDRLERDPALGRSQPDVAAKVAARQANRPDQRRRRPRAPRPGRRPSRRPTAPGHRTTRSRRRRDARCPRAARRRPPSRDDVADPRSSRVVLGGQHDGHRGTVAPKQRRLVGQIDRSRRRAAAGRAGLSSSASTAWVSGSPKRQLNSTTAGPREVIASPA